jgi:hypothetical protein
MAFLQASNWNFFTAFALTLLLQNSIIKSRSLAREGIRLIHLEALREGLQMGLPQLGKLCPLENQHAVPLSIRQKLMVDSFGSYTKQIITPLYDRSAVSTLPLERQTCLGAVSPFAGKKVIGTLLRSSSVYRMYLPVFESSDFSPLFYRKAGILAAEEGYFSVFAPRKLPWLLLGLVACGLVFLLRSAGGGIS